MAIARSAHVRDFTAPAATPTRSASFWQRLYAAMVISRQRQAERDIAMYLRNTGGKFTDDAEREIERRFLGPTHW